METGADGSAVHGSPAVTAVTVDIDPAVLARFNALPDKCSALRKRPTKDQLDLLRLAWPCKLQKAVARDLGVSEATARAWYREFIEKKGA
jgi:hypothetical protein